MISKKTSASLQLEAQLRKFSYDLTSEIEVYGPIVANKWSKIYYGKRPRYTSPVVIKVCLGHEINTSPTEAAAAYFHSMQRLHDVTSRNSAIASPKPYAFIPELGVVIAEWIPGQSLDALVKRASDAAALSVIRDVGVWLARLASAAGYSRRPLDTERMLRGIGDEGKTGSLDQAVSMLRRTAGLVQEREVVWSPHFGDFKPANLLLSGGRIYGIDSQMTEIGPGVIDAANFLNHVALLRVSPLGGRAAAWTARLDETFRQGHETDGGLELPALPLLWTRLHGAVHLALGYRSWSRPPQAWVTGWVLRRLLRHLHARLEGSCGNLAPPH